MPATALDLVEVSSGHTRLHLRVKPGSKANAVLGIYDGALKLAVIARPERGKANRAALRLLATQLGVPPTSIELVAGGSAPDKTVLVPLSRAAILERIAAKEWGQVLA